MDTLIKPFTIEREDYCIKCKTKKSIELYNIYDKPMRYSNLLDYSNTIDLSSILDNSSLSYMRCKKCGTIYKIYWRGNKPEPLDSNIFYDNFLQNYSGT